MPQSAVISLTDAVRTPPPARPAVTRPDAGAPSTRRVAVTPTPARIATPLPARLALESPLPPEVTPPPASDLSVSLCSWGAGAEAVGARRAPRVGDTLLGFKLVAELGRGAFARVYLAEQASLANRPVALKVTLRPTREAERLARLQHTNVVPVYSVHDGGPVQVICMPFLGRVTLAALIRAHRTENASRYLGRKSTSARAARTTALDGGSKSHSKFIDSKGGPARAPTWTWSSEGPPPIVGDPTAVLQVLAQLAGGLAHAHERGILHLDLKPANVLLADTGEPMLLDFNLSFDAADPAREQVGGTVPYMAIEQLLDMRSRGKGRLDGRADLYSLGVLAFELLTGELPFPASSHGLRDFDEMVAARRAGPPSIRERNPAVTPAVEAIVRKLLAAEPEGRYQSAAELREDIERHLGDRPLKYARETSLRERFGKWRRRNPRLPLRIAAAGFLVLAACLGGVAYIRAEEKAEAEAQNARVAAALKAEGVHAALDSVRIDLVLPNDPAARARGVKKAADLLGAYGLPEDAGWRARPDVSRLTDARRTALAGDLGELMGLLAQAKWRDAEARPEAARRALAAEAWKLNVAARACFEDGAVPPLLARQAAALAPVVGETFSAGAARAPAGAHELFLDATDVLARGRYKDAIELFDRVLTAQPNQAAAHFCLAHCRQQRGEYERALERYDAARVLFPTDPLPAYHRGLIHGLRLEPAKAEVEFTKALAIEPEFADAYRHRALARYRLGANEADRGRAKEAAKKFAEAEADLTAALERGAPERYVRCIRAQVRERLGDRVGAKADWNVVRDAVLTTDEDFIARGWSRMAREPEAAAEDFRQALEINPWSLVALQNLTHTLADKLQDSKKALAVADRLARSYPENAPVVAGRAVLLARLGRREEAHKEVARARLLSEDAQILYQAACVYSLTSRENEKDLPKALELLRAALRKGYADVRGMGSDPDLAPIRANGEFQEIRRAASTLYR